tara:strand:- start:4896 stop:5171 length:276 start_codon:yes stop_codon:yes gene_type:complete
LYLGLRKASRKASTGKAQVFDFWLQFPRLVPVTSYEEPFLDPLQPAERRPILVGKQKGRLRKHRHAMEKVNAGGRETGLGRGLSMRPSKIG